MESWRHDNMEIGWLVEIISGMTSEWTVNIIHLPAKYKQDAALQTGRVEEVERI